MNDLGARVRRLPADSLACLSFFSRLPISAPFGAFDLRTSSAAWPLSGFVLAAVPAVLLWVALAANVPNSVAALLALAALAAITGALHEDGLADTADGLGGGRDRAAMLAIMRDSRIGTYGTLALLFSVAIRAAALAALAAFPFRAALALVLAATLSRALALWHWHHHLPARSDGLAFAAGRPDWLAFAIGAGTGALAAILALAVFGLAGLLGLVMALFGTIFFAGLCRRTLGGHSGDTIGAAQQIAETLLLAGLSAGAIPTAIIWTPPAA